MKRYKIADRLICLLAGLALLLCSCGTQTPPKAGSDTTGTSAVTDPAGEDEPVRRLQLTNNGRAAYRIILPEDCSEELSAEVETLRKALVSLTGIAFYISNDRTGDGAVVSGASEMVIGNCRRTESQELLKELRYRDYAVCATEANILIAGHEDTTVLRAIRYLIAVLEHDGVVQDGGNHYLMWEDYRYTASSYRLEQMTIQGVALSEYRIVYAADALSTAPKQLAEQIQQAIGRASGYVLPVVTDAEPESDYEILIGNTNRNVSTKEDLLCYRVGISDRQLVFSAGGYYSLGQAVAAFAAYLNDSDDGVLDGISLEDAEILTVPDHTGDYRFASYNILVEYEGWGSGGDIPSDVQIRKEPVAAILLGYLPDVAALCEVFDTWSENLPPMLAEVYDWVEPELSDGNCNRSPLIYRKDRLRVLESGYQYIESTVSPINQRVVTWALFENRESGERFLVFGTHLDSVSDTERLLEAQTIVAFTERLRQQYQVPAVLMGDLNSTSVGDAYQELIDNTDFTSAYAPGHYPWVDHILCTPELYVVKAGTDGNAAAQTASDHRLIYADVNLNHS